MENTQRLKIDLSTAPWAECCDGQKMFETKLMFKRISALLSPTGKEEFFQMEVVVCSGCGKVPAFMWNKYPGLPEELKAKEPNT